MNKWIKFGIPIFIVILVFFYFSGTYNQMVTKEEQVKTAWSQVENQFQRRADLIPNLVSTVKGFASQEEDVLTAVTNARSQAGQTDVNINDAQEMAQFQESQSELSSALSRLLVTVEAYPNLRSNQNFLELQAQLEGTENRIATERMRYNEAARSYNTYIRQFPNMFFASLFGFNRSALFTSDEGSDTTPEVEFE